ncbi:MAG: excinuclease ABC subunit UvrC, partial [archaeon]|nr:excinuclease ABC subunit UvrC [archaeon]
KKIKKKKSPCLYYQLKLCLGPCIDAIDKKIYNENVKQIELFLKGETDILKTELTVKMQEAAENQDFEMAAFWRDKLEAIDHSTSSQDVLLHHEANKDIVGYYTDEQQKYVSMVMIHIRDGKISNKSPYTLDIRDKIVHKKELFALLIEQFYQGMKSGLPDIIIIPELFRGVEVLRDVLEDKNNNLMIRTPLKDEFGLMRIAIKNAKVMVEQEIQMEDIKVKEEDSIQKALETAVELLDLPKKPRIIEGFDISNIEGVDATGSMVYFLEGKPYTKYYRHFNIKSKSTPDDVGMMKEVIYRRYSKLLENNWQLPDLILVDGGKGQLNAGVSVLKDLGLEIPIIGLAKKFEEIFLPGEKNPIILPKNSPLLKIFQKVRDEAHRFAVRLHKKRRTKRITGSLLDDIKGVGPATRNKLLKQFNSVDGIKKASIEELSQVVGEKLAKLIKEAIL